MARNKRASMREGPLAALFQSTIDEEKAAEEEVSESRPATPEPPEPAQTTPEHRAPREDPVLPPEPEEARDEPRIYVNERPAEPAPPERVAAEVSVSPPRDGLRRVFGDSPDRANYGRQDPRVAYGQPSIHMPVLRVVGVGGAGVNAVNRMIEAGVTGVEFLAVNTDLQSLQQSAADVTIHIGAELTRGLGSGADPALGHEAAMAGYDKIKSLLKGSDMVFIAAGAGGGTGTGAAPVVARIARELDALAVGIVTKPFAFEGKRRSSQADEGILALQEEVDTVITIPNNRLLSVLDRNTSMLDAFRVADDVLRQGVQGISDLITLPGLINLDFADVRTIMSDAGSALLGIGMGVGENRAADAAEKAVSSPLLETSVDGAKAILLSITGGGDLSLLEVSEAARVVQEAAHPDANIIFGATVDDELGEQCWITVVATRFDDQRTAFERPVVSSERRGARRHVRADAGSDDLEVPEFIPGI